MTRIASIVVLAAASFAHAEDYRLPPANEPTLSLYVEAVRVKGVTAFTASEIDAITAPYTKRLLTTEDLLALRHALSQHYLDAGYVSSGVVIPDQEPVDGVLELEALEGTLTRIDIEGDPALADRYVTRRLRRHLDGPLNVAALQYALQWLQLDPNVTRLDARLVPGDVLGDATLALTIDEPPRFSMALSANNYGSSSVGSERGVLSASVTNLTGFGERFAAYGALADGSNDWGSSFDVPLTRWNTRLSAYYSTSDGKIIERAFEDLDIESQTDTWGVAISQPLIERLNDTLTLTVGFEAKHSETELLGLPFSFSPGAHDGVTDSSAVLTGLQYSSRGNNHVATLRATWHHGIDALDATIFDPANDLEALQNPTGADSEFDILQLQGLYLYRLNALPLFSSMPDRAQIVVRSTAQIAGDPLMSLEKIAIGGAHTVRGYPENMLVRDNGVAATIEVQLPIPGYRAEPHPLNLVIAPFIDYGRSWDEADTDLLSSVRDTDEARTIVGAGIGIVWSPFRGFAAQVYWGFDAADDFDGDDPRDSMDDDDLQADGVHFEATYSIQL